MKYRESEEMYLETILLMNKDGKPIRSIDIASELNYSRASVSIALKKLVDKGYVNVNSLGYVILTEEGEEKANNIYERHCIITKVLMDLGASKELAEDNACNIEHVVTDELIEVLKQYINKK